MTPALLLAAVSAVLAFAVTAANAQVSRDGDTVASGVRHGSAIDYANARPFPLPLSTGPRLSQSQLIADGEAVKLPGKAEVFSGKDGNGKQTPKILPRNKALAVIEGGGVTSQEFGSSKHVYTTSLSLYPTGTHFRRAGKLFFRDGGGSFVCSASLIKRGLVVTAAHCVSKFGESRFFTNIQYVPAYDRGAAPYGTWNATQVRVMNSYYTGTETCAVRGVVCPNDVAVIVLTPKSGAYPGTQTGWFGYATGGYSYANGQASITQLGYPVALNNGERQIITTSQGSVSASNSNNTVIGSLQTGGSSGGPWLVNFGSTPTITDPSTGLGSSYTHNVVVGTTSWGYTNTTTSGPKEQGASPFTSANITSLVNAACGSYPAACN